MRAINLVRDDYHAHYCPAEGPFGAAILCTDFVDQQFPEAVEPPKIHLRLSKTPAPGLQRVFVAFQNCEVTLPGEDVNRSIFAELRDLILQFVWDAEGPGPYSGAHVYMGLFLGHADGEEGAP